MKYFNSLCIQTLRTHRCYVMSDLTSASLLERKALAAQRGEALFIGAFGFTGQNLLKDVHRFDMWQLTIVLGIALAYLYTRRAETVILIFVGFYFFEYAVFWLLAWLLRNTSAAFEKTHSRTLTLLTDPIVAGLSLLVAYYIIEFTSIGTTGTGSDITLARNLQSSWRTTIVLLTTLLTGFVRLYWLSFAILLSTIWFLYMFDSNRADPLPDYALWLASRASIFVVFYTLAFMRPFGETFLSNAWFALAAAVWFASAIEFVISQQ